MGQVSVKLLKGRVPEKLEDIQEEEGGSVTGTNTSTVKLENLIGEGN